MTITANTSLSTINTSLNLTTSNDVEVEETVNISSVDLSLKSGSVSSSSHSNSNSSYGNSYSSSYVTTTGSINGPSTVSGLSTISSSSPNINSVTNNHYQTTPNLDNIDEFNKFLLAEQPLTAVNNLEQKTTSSNKPIPSVSSRSIVDNNAITTRIENKTITTEVNNSPTTSKTVNSAITTRIDDKTITDKPVASNITKSVNTKIVLSNANDKNSNSTHKLNNDLSNKNSNLANEKEEKIRLNYANDVQVDIDPRALASLPEPIRRILLQPLPVKELAALLSALFAKPSRKKALQEKNNKSNETTKKSTTKAKNDVIVTLKTNTRKKAKDKTKEEKVPEAKNYLDLRERKIIEFLLKLNFSYRLIAQILMLDKTKVWREVTNFLKQNPKFTSYNAIFAHRQNQLRLSQRGRKTNAFLEEQQALQQQKLADAKAKMARIPTLGITTSTEEELANINKKRQEETKKKLQQILGSKLTKLK